MSLQVLLHVVGARELLLTTRERALHSLLGGVDLGVPGSVTRGSKGLLAAVSLAVTARVALARALRKRRGNGAVVLVGVGSTAVGVSRALQRLAVMSVFAAKTVERCAGVGEVQRRCQR
jgi:hypothetical protein